MLKSSELVFYELKFPHFSHYPQFEIFSLSLGFDDSKINERIPCG